MEKIEIYKKLVELEEKREAHNKEFADAIRSLADRNSTQMIMTGNCPVCNEIDEEIFKLESLLNNKNNE